MWSRRDIQSIGLHSICLKSFEKQVEHYHESNLTLHQSNQ